jgi:hypothetical protein
VVGIGTVGDGVVGLSKNGDGVLGRSDSGHGIRGYSNSFYGVLGRSERWIGVYGFSSHRSGVFGESYSADGVSGRSEVGVGVAGESPNFIGVAGKSIDFTGVSGTSSNGTGVFGGSRLIGVHGSSATSDGVYGSSGSGIGVHGFSTNNVGVFGRSTSSMETKAPAVYGHCDNGVGVSGFSNSNYGLFGRSDSGLAALLEGTVNIIGKLTVSGFKSFKIDHPLDPSNKYLYHSSVESSDMKNIYDGVIALDERGEAEVELPNWLGSFNKDFRYQLTAIGAPGPNLYIAEEITSYITNNGNNKSKNYFKIAEGTLGMKVSWQVTGIRNDSYARANPIQVEEDKPDKERGYYLHPDLYGRPSENAISRLFVPEEELLVNEN